MCNREVQITGLPAENRDGTEIVHFPFDLDLRDCHHDHQVVTFLMESKRSHIKVHFIIGNVVECHENRS